jgi:hypothetical protein
MNDLTVFLDLNLRVNRGFKEQINRHSNRNIRNLRD